MNDLFEEIIYGYGSCEVRAHRVLREVFGWTDNEVLSDSESFRFIRTQMVILLESDAIERQISKSWRH